MRNNHVLPIAAILGFALAGCSSKAPETPAEPPKTAAEAPVPAPESALIVGGEVESVDPKGESITIRTKDGKVQKVEVSPDTEVKGLKSGAEEVAKGAEGLAKAAAAEVKKGTKVAITYTEKEGKLVARKVQHATKEVVKESEVVIHKIEDGGKKVVVKTKDGAEHVYEVSKDATVAAAKKTGDFGHMIGGKISEGAKATFHFTEESGKKVVHFVQH